MAALTHHSTAVLETAIDWLTVSSKRKSVVSRWEVHCLTLQQREARDGAKLGPWHLNHYAGQACGRVRFGYSTDAILVQLSGEVADSEFAYFWRDHNTVTRIDVAVTVRTDRYDPTLALRAYTEALAFRETNPRAALPTVICNGDDGSTLYIGKRSSSRFFRLYNKEQEQRSLHDPAADDRYLHAWRYELELHDVDAQAVGMMLAEPGGNGPKIRYYLSHYLQSHGLSVPFDPGERAALPTGFRRRSDRDTRLDWLRRTVRPTIDWLRTSCTADELASILGLDDTRGEAIDNPDNPSGE